MTNAPAATSVSSQRLKKSTKVTIKPMKGEKRKDGSPKTARPPTATTAKKLHGAS